MRIGMPLVRLLSKIALLALIGGLLPQMGTAQPAADQPTPDLASLEAFIDGYVAAKIVDMEPPGMAVAAVTPEGTITRGYGMANMKTGEAATEDTLFRIGSISKLFVWISVHMLVDEGKIDLDADVNTYFDNVTIPDAFGRPITMRDLMAHRPGFEDSYRDFLDPDRDIPLRDAMARSLPRRVAPPGERTSYSNSGTNLAALVVEEVSGVDYFDFVTSRILEPARLNSTTLHDPGTGRNPPALDRRTAVPHKLRNGMATVSGYQPVRPQEASGSVSMSAKDAARFMELLLSGTELEDGGRLLSEESWARIATNAFPDGAGGDDMGWGFMLNDVDGVATLGHGGATAFLSWLFIVPERGVGVFVSSNMNTPQTRGEDLAWSIVRRISGKDALAAFRARAGDIAAAKEAAGTYLTNRRPFYGVAALFSLGSEIDVAADDGYIVMNETRYAPIADDVWVALNGSRLRVDRGEDGKIERLHGAFGSATFERVGLWGSTRPLLAAIVLSGVLSITTLLGMWWRIGRTNKTTLTGRRAKWIAMISAFVWLAFLGLFAASLMTVANLDITKIDESGFPPIWFKLMLAAMVALAIQAVAHVGGLYWVWRGSGWGWWRRVHYSLFATAFVFAVIGFARLGAIGTSLGI
jgi:CubicO group peptidase (beta-lactamase class C family)